MFSQEPVVDSLKQNEQIIPPTTTNNGNNIPEKNTTDQNKLTLRFAKQIVEFNRGELIANVLIVTNNLPEAKKFYVNFTIPIEWKVITKNHILYELQSGDSLIIPVYIVPREKFKGSVRLIFYAFANDEQNNTLGMSYFYGLLNKNIRWTLTVSDKKIYLPHGAENMHFYYGLINESTDEQDIAVSAQIMKKNILLKDSQNLKIVKFPQVYKLQPFQDTVIHLTFNKTKEPRNFRLVDIESYQPYSLGEAKKYRIYFNSVSPNPAENKKYRSGNNIEFVELSDSWTVNQFSSQSIPLLVDANIYNIIGGQPMMNLFLRSETFFKDSSLLLFQSQFTFFSNYLSTKPFENGVYYISYFAKKYNIQFGNINSGLIGTPQVGKGLKGEYYFSRNHHIGFFYVAQPELFKIMPSTYSYGLTHFYENKIIRINTILGRYINQNSNTNTEVANTNLLFKLFKKHSFGIRLGGSHSLQLDSNYSKIGYFVGANYSGTLFPFWRISINGNYNSPDFGIFKNERLSANLNNSFKIKNKLQIQHQSNFYQYKQTLSNTVFTNQILNNQLNFNNLNNKILNYHPFIFYNLSNIQNFIVHSRGIGLNISRFNLDNNVRYFFNIRSGYNYAYTIHSKNYFFTQASFYWQIRTFSILARYQLGNLSVTPQHFLTNSIKNHQLIGISTKYQYQFKHPSFIYQQLLGYSYSTFNGNNINFNPEIYYFSLTGWRFRIFADINLSRNIPNNVPSSYYYMNFPEEIEHPKWYSNFYLGAGIRKEFGIPVPFVKKTNGTVTFIAFYDLNGNGKQEKNESEIENIVVQILPWEVMTNEKGKCELKNIPFGIYPIRVFSIENKNEWFPNVSDSIIINKPNQEIQIPFIRGVKITGKVFVQRDPNSPTADFKLDVSRIKISASNHKIYSTLTDKNGNFVLYLPAGKYILTLDESILGNRLYLLKNNFELDITDKFDNLFIPFYIVEKPKKIKVIRFDSNGNPINE